MNKLGQEVLHEFKLDIFAHETFEYFGFNLGGYSEAYDICGICSTSDGKIALRLMHFEIEMLEEDEEFSPIEMANPYIALNVPDYMHFLDFLEYIFLKEKRAKTARTYFELLTAEELTAYHYPESLIKIGLGKWYRYNEKDHLGDGQIRLISIPAYNKQYGNHQILGLHFITFHESRLQDKQFNLLFGSQGLGTITLSREALAELIDMLRKVMVYNPPLPTYRKAIEAE